MLRLLLLALQVTSTGNLALGRAVSAAGVSGNATAVTDGRYAAEAAAPTNETTLSLGPKGEATIDLGAPVALKALVLQGSAASRFDIQISGDGRAFAPMSRLPAVPGRSGLLTRALQMGSPRTARFLRVTADPPGALSELQAFSELPREWPPERTRRPAGGPGAATPGALTRLRLVKLLVAAAGTVFLAWDARRRARAAASGRLRDASFAALGILGLACWFNFGLFHFGHFLHLWDVYHYYAGAKYFHELGYTRLYECTAASEVELGHGDEIARIDFRDLTDDRLVSGRRALDTRPCRSQFSPERWEAFKRDTEWFRSRMPLERWHAIKQDHGFNPTPVWTMAGGLFAGLSPGSDSQIALLALLDPLLLAGLLGAAGWAFGWRASCIAALFLGTNTAADFGWIGGSYLRFDWLALLVVGVCLLRRGRPFLGGFALGWASLIRIFPAALAGAVVLAEVVAMLRERRRTPRREPTMFVAGAVAAVFLLVPLAALATGTGVDAWRRFAVNTRKHLATPSVNNIGLKTALSFTPEVPLDIKPGEEIAWTWWQRHERALQSRRPIEVLLAGGFAVLLVRALRGAEAWEAAVLGAGLIPFLTVMSCYYAVVFVMYALLWTRVRTAGVLLSALAAVSALVSIVARWTFEEMVLFSVAALVAIVIITVAAAPKLGRSRRSAEPVT